MLKQVAVVTWLAAASIVVVVMLLRITPSSVAASAPALPSSPSFDRITVHRIDVVEPDGKPRLIASSAAQYPGAYFGGKEYPHPDRTQTGGLLFYNDDGTEAGGWGYSNRRDGSSYEAGAVLTMDQYNQNETMKLTYEESDGKRGAGLVVYGDRPDASMEPVVIAERELLAAKTDPDKAKAKAKLDKLVETNIGKQVKRVFVGRMVDDAMVALADSHDQPRIVMQVDGKGEPSIQFFDAAGKPTKTIAGK